MSWRKFLIVGCSHAQMIDQSARRAVLAFGRSYKPHFVAHLGDAVDCTAFRSGAGESADSAASIDFDLSSGLSFLTEFLALGRVRVYIHGNHEGRLPEVAKSPRDTVARSARSCIREIDDACESIGAHQVPYDGIRQGYMLGDTRLMHGVFFNTMAARDHAEAFGRCMFSHTHHVAIATGRRADAPMGYNIGWLGDPAKAGYAKCRRATMGWRQAFAWGEYSDSATVINLCVRGEDGSWRLP